MVGGWIGETLSLLVRPFELVGEAISYLGEKLSVPLEATKNFLSDIGSGIVTLLTYLNPFHENFILKVAFVPDQEFMEEYASDFDGLLKTKLGFFFQIKDTMVAFTTSIKSQTSTWQGIKIDLSGYGLGKIEIVNAYAIQQYGEKLRFWIGGLMLFLTGAWLVRKGSKILGEGR